MMQWLSRFSIKTRLLVALITCLVLFSVFGITTLMGIGNVTEVTNTIYEDALKVSNAALEARLGITRIQRDFSNVLLLDDKEEMYKIMEATEVIKDGILVNLGEIRQRAKMQENLALENEAREMFLRWRRIHEEILNLKLNSDMEQINIIMNGRYNDLTNQIKQNLITIDENAKARASSLIKEATNIESGVRFTLLSLLFALIVFLILFFTLIIRSILYPINTLKEAMDSSTVTTKLTKANLTGHNEIAEIAKFYNMLIQKLREQFWVKDNQNSLNQEITGARSMDELTQRVINFLARTVDAGKGAFYVYRSKDKLLKLNSSFAFTDRHHLSNSYQLGEGIIGQVALEKKSILLKNIDKQQMYIETGVVQEAPVNIYAFPLVYENQLYGVIELASFQPFDKLKQEFMDNVAEIISINVKAAMQNQRIKDLLQLSEQAQKEARETAGQLQITNQTLEDQQRLLQQQTEELQKTNAELEEQQQLQQQQSEEMHQTNAQLEKQQQLLEEQSRLLNIKNQELESSREELIKYSQQLEMVNKYKSEFLANMSHELRTPLNSIILLSKLIMKNGDKNLSKDNLEKASIIHNSGNELLRLINDILDLSKIEAGRVDLSRVEFYSGDLVNELKQLFQDMAMEKNIELRLEDKLDTVLVGDRGKISQILRNLLSNALKFTERGQVSLGIESSPQDDGTVIFSVSDTGIGIEAQSLERIFEEFQQGDGSISRKYGGTGLGLSISKKLAEVMEGNLTVKSQVGEGSQFQLSVPNTIVKDDPEFLDRQLWQSLEQCAITQEEEVLFLKGIVKKENDSHYLISKTNREYSLRLDGKKILIVDDDSRNIFVLASALEEYGAEIVEAQDGEVALDKLREQKIDLVLMDIMMPNMDGFEAIKQIRKDKQLRETPIIAVTAKSLKEDAERCIAAGADDYISKPVDYDVLITLVNAWINK